MKQTQCDKIFDYMLAVGPITPLDALREYGCMRLAARIGELKKKGWNIKSELTSSINRDGDVVRFKEYWI